MILHLHTSIAVPFGVVCVLSISLGLLLVHHAWIYYKLFRISTPSLKGRYSRVTLWIVVLGAAFFLIAQPYMALVNMLEMHNVYTVYVSKHLLSEITSLIYPFIIAYRSWMVYYKIKWNMAMEDTEWSKFIDTNSNQNWFLRHYWFNKKYAAWIFVAVWCVLEIPTLFLTMLGEPYLKMLTVVYGIQYFGPVFFLAVLLYKIPVYDDVFYIRDEMKLILTASLVTAILYVPAIFSLIFLHRAVFILIIVEVYALIGPFCILYAHLYFPLKTFYLPQTLCALKRYLNDPEAGKNARDRGQSELKLKLREVLECPDRFPVFARHVNKEFAVENLLFLLEIYQFQQKMLEIFGSDQEIQTSNTTLSGIDAVHFPSNMPKSTLISNMNRQNVYQCVAELFNKYIAEDAYFTINISYEMRMELYELFAYDKNRSSVDVLTSNVAENISTDWNKLYHAFDAQRSEIYQLLGSSFTRFQQTDSYERLLSVQSPTMTMSRSSSVLNMSQISVVSTTS